MLILVTGKSGSGKSTIAKTLAQELDYLYIDIDKIGHSFYDIPENLKQIEKLFGKVIYTNGAFDRKKLGRLVFENKNPKATQEFNRITYNYICEQIDIKSANNNVVLDWILLPQTKYWGMSAYKVLAVCKSDEERFSKLIARDNVKLEYLKLRDRSAIDYSLSDFDKIIINDYNFDHLNKIVKEVKSDILKHKEQRK